MTGRVDRLAKKIPFVGLSATVCMILAPFSAFLSRNHEFVTIVNIWRYPTVAASTAVLCGLCVTLIYGRLWGTRVALLFGWGIFALFLYRDVERLLDSYLSFLGVPAELFWTLFLLIGATVLARLAEKSRVLITILLFSLTLSVLPLAQYWYVAQNVGSGIDERFATTSMENWPVKPDIYFLILDGLARTDVFDRIYDFNFEPFDDVLRQEGFVIADRALGAHPMTWLSVPAILDQEYQAVPGPRGRPATHARADRIMSGASRTHEELVAQGYKFVTATEGGGPFCDLSLSPVRDLTTCLVQGNSIDAAIRLEFAKLTPLHGLANRGLLPDVLSRWLAAEDLRWTSENAIGRTFLVDDLLRTVASAKSENGGAAVFVLAHMLYPHPPFTLDSECGPSSHPGFRPSVDAWDDLVGLRMGAECTQKQILELISEVDRDAVIVLQSDHGPGRGLLRDGNYVQDVPIEDLWTRASVYSAVRLPARCRDSVPDTFAGTSTFPVVFGCLSGHTRTLELPRSLWAWYEGREVRDLTSRLRAYEDSLATSS